MKRVPKAGAVDQALKRASSAIAACIASIDEDAGRIMARGKYDAAAAMAERGRSLRKFQDSIKALQSEWRALRGGGRGGGGSSENSQRTPLWGYYQPVLRSLVRLGGEARRRDIEPAVQDMMKESLLPGDVDILGRGRLRWQVMVARTRRHLVDEGWIESGSSPTWRITAAGRKAADADLRPPHGRGKPKQR